MLISKNGKISPSKDMMVLEDSQRTLWWRGLIFIKGTAEGRASLLRFVELVDQQGLPAACDQLSGTFSCVIQDKKSQTIYAFTDNSRVANLYYNDEFISTSFLELAKTCKPTADELQSQAVCAFILTGQMYHENALFQSISFLDPTEILLVKGQSISREKKQLRPIYDLTVSREELYNNLREIIASLQDKKISLDMSGGSDTRTLAGVLKQLGMDFELSTDCAAGLPDHEIAKKAAAILARPHYITWHTVQGIDVSAELEETFVRADGLMDVLANHTTFQNYLQREKRHMQVVISGFAGELHKDGGWWRVAMQTLFTPAWKEAIVKKLVYSGLGAWGYDPNLPAHLFAGAYRTTCEKFSDTLYENLMKNYSGRNRVELADKIFYEFSIRTPRSLTQSGLDYYPILLDYNVLPFGLHRPPLRRLFAKEYRLMLYQADKKLARLETTKVGTSLSPEWRYLAVDIAKLCRNAFNTMVLKKKKKYPVNALYALVRKRPETQRYVDLLKKAGVLNAELQLEQIADSYLGRIYTVGKVLETIR